MLVLEVYSNPAGRASATSTLVAVDGPSFLTAMVYVTSSPTAGALLETYFFKLRSAQSFTVTFTGVLVLLTQPLSPIASA